MEESTPPLKCRSHRWHELGSWVKKIPWRRKWQHTPVFLPRKSHGHWSLMGYSPYHHRESDVTDQVNARARARAHTHTHTHTHTLVLHSVCTNLHFYQHKGSHFFLILTSTFSFHILFLIIAILTGIKWYLLVFLICISLIMILSAFSGTYLYVFFGKMSIHVLC